VALGYRTSARGNYSMAFGYRASTNGHTGAKVFGDASTTDSILAVANNEFAVRASGGYRFRTNATLTTGCNLPAGSGVFSCSSSRLLKEGVEPVDGGDVLARIRRVPVNTWSYSSEAGGVRHMGPFAEDFHAAFGLGTDDTSIGHLDIAGVTFAGVQALDARTLQLDARVSGQAAEMEQLRAENRSLRAGNAELEARIARIEALLAAQPAP
ncbi:MAG: tail fiber domain-containing protein, partial [Gemmatimonadetes bacterium]|nr:tail fiber domain-containing protein [Gemmatimonadota bacterium]